MLSQQNLLEQGDVVEYIPRQGTGLFQFYSSLHPNSVLTLRSSFQHAGLRAARSCPLQARVSCWASEISGREGILNSLRGQHGGSSWRGTNSQHNPGTLLGHGLGGYKESRECYCTQRMRREKKKGEKEVPRLMLQILEPQIVYYSYYTDGSNSLTISP